MRRRAATCGRLIGDRYAAAARIADRRRNAVVDGRACDAASRIVVALVGGAILADTVEPCRRVVAVARGAKGLAPDRAAAAPLPGWARRATATGRADDENARARRPAAGLALA